MKSVISLNARVRIQQHVEYLKQHIEIGDKIDQKNFDYVYENFQQVAKKLRIYQWVRNVVGLLLYVGVIAAFTQSISQELATLLSPLVAISSVIGFSILTVLFVLLNALIHTVLMDLASEHTHLVAILIKHNDEFIAHPHFALGLIKQYE